MAQAAAVIPLLPLGILWAVELADAGIVHVCRVSVRFQSSSRECSVNLQSTFSRAPVNVSVRFRSGVSRVSVVLSVNFQMQGTRFARSAAGLRCRTLSGEFRAAFTEEI